MKYILCIVLFSTAAYSQNHYDALGETQSPPTSEPCLEERNTDNLFLTELFEKENLDQNPSLSDFYPEFAVDHSFALEQNIKRAGNAAGRFEINKEDPQIWSATRSELSQAQSTARPEGWYGFSQYFPDTYVLETSGEVITQWHDQADQGEAVDRSPSNGRMGFKTKKLKYGILKS